MYAVNWNSRACYPLPNISGGMCNELLTRSHECRKTGEVEEEIQATCSLKTPAMRIWPCRRASLTPTLQFRKGCCKETSRSRTEDEGGTYRAARKQGGHMPPSKRKRTTREDEVSVQRVAAERGVPHLPSKAISSKGEGGTRRVGETPDN